MGLLSTLLTVGGAAAGFALGGPGGASLGASLGGAVGGGIDQSHASSKASKALIEAQQQAQAAREQGFQRVSDIQAPGVAAYSTGINALTGRLGLQAPAAQPAPAPTSLDPSASTSPTYDGGKTPGGFAGVSPVETNALTGAPASSTYQSGTTPSPQPAVQQQPQTGPDPGTYGNADPNYTPTSYTAPADFTYGMDQFKASPGYQYQQDEARKSILASASATGALQSGAALKELQDRAQNIAYQDFTGERAFAAGRSDTDRTFHRTDYADTRDFNYGKATTDRNYLTGRSDTQTNNLFNYTGLGQNAAGIVSNAATGVANGAAGAALGIGDAKAGNALQQGNISSGMVNTIAGLGSSYLTGQNALTGDLQAGARKNPYLF